jgi:hypothetical protein
MIPCCLTQRSLIATLNNGKMLNMEYSPERGKEKRQAQIEPVVLTDKTAGNHCYAKLNYMSCHAMYFETECAFKPGTMIDIQLISHH